MKCILCSLLMLAFLQPAMAQRKYNRTDGGPTQINMTEVAAGSYTLGSNEEDKDRMPSRTVTLSPFYIGTYEITQAQWKAVMGSNPSSYQCDDCAVTNISWNDVQAFLEKLNGMTGKHYRLPTEAEWEYAAIGGGKEKMTRYSGKDEAQTIAWFERNAKDHIHQVGFKKPNEIGIYDMSGNAEEWCSDYYQPNYGSRNATANPHGTETGKAHVVRGGS